MAKSELTITASALSDVGCRRETNEDAVIVVTPHDAGVRAAKGVLLVVADGMGGHAAGEVASRLAVDTVRRTYYDSPQAPGAALVEAVQAANAAIHRQATGNPSLEGMGTTCTALALCRDEAHCAHVGDSRLYLIRGGELYLMTEDHSAVQDMVNRGLLRPAEARHHAERNVILRAVGTRESVEVAIWPAPFPVRAGDRFLLSTDGLHDLVTDDELLAVGQQQPPDIACQMFVNAARERGGYDNISVAMALAQEASSAGTPAATTADFKVVP